MFVCLFSQETIRVLGEVPSDENTAVPKKTVKIIDCGVNELSKPYDLSNEQVESTEDL